MNNNALKELVDRFDQNLSYYKTTQNAYNEHSCRIEYIDPLLEVLGWDVANRKGLAPRVFWIYLCLELSGVGLLKMIPRL